MLGNKSNEGIAQLLLYKSKDLINWDYEKTLISSNDLGYMIECPSSVKLKNKRVLIMSPQGLKVIGNDYWNIYSSVYTICPLNMENINYHNIKEIDHGLDFYAAHAISNGDILISWMQIWERTIPSIDEGQLWTNAFTLPRKLSLKKEKLIQKPLNNLTKHFTKGKEFKGYIKKERVIKGFSGHYKYLHIEFNKGGDFSIKLLKKKNHYAEIKYDNDMLYIDRRNSLIPIKSFFEEKSSSNYRQIQLNKRKITLDIYLDRFLIEVFINNGEEVMSMTTYHPDDYKRITFESKKGKNVKIISHDFKYN